MTTPVCDFVTGYALSGTARFHMPGHKGVALHGMEKIDITEIDGAGYFYSDTGIIRESEKNASLLFGSGETFYSTEGSSLSVKAMLAIAISTLRREGERPLILSARNSHKAFFDAACLLDFDIGWIMPKKPSRSLCQAFITADDVREAIEGSPRLPLAVYITSPDYMGNIADIAAIKAVCKSFDIPLLVDNAHGAYLKFLEKSLHPLDLGADMCCDSAHKTLPVYTGGGYLHISRTADSRFAQCAKGCMSLFGSTSPSYIIIQSLDNCNRLLSNEFPTRLSQAVKDIADIKAEIASMGFELIGDEPMKITILPLSFGLSGDALAEHLRENGVECEYSDPYSLVLMPSVYNSNDDYDRLTFALSLLSRKKPLSTKPLVLPAPITRLSAREAFFGRAELIDADNAEGRVCARTALSCQPSIPIVAAGEEITGDIIKILKSYSIFKINVL